MLRSAVLEYLHRLGEGSDLKKHGDGRSALCHLLLKSGLEMESGRKSEHSWETHLKKGADYETPLGLWKAFSFRCAQCLPLTRVWIAESGC